MLIAILLCASAAAQEAAPPLMKPEDAQVFVAITQRDFDILRELLRHGANPNAINGAGIPALAMAIASGSTDPVQALLEAGADPKALIKEHNSMLMAAAGVGTADQARMLLDKGADPNARNDYGGTALMIAALKGKPDQMRLLLEHGAWPYPMNSDGTSALELVRKNSGDPEQHAEEELLLKYGAPADGRNRPIDESLLGAVKSGDLAKANAALAGGADANAWHCEMAMGTCVMAPALALAIVNQSMLDLLLRHGAGVNFRTASGLTVLHLAAANDDPAIINFLVKHGASLNARASDGSTPLYKAIDANRPANVEMLVRLGAESDIGGPHVGESLLEIARRPGHDPRIATLLEKSGSDEDAPLYPNPSGCEVDATPPTPCALAYYARNGNPKAVSRMLDAGVDANSHDENSMPALLQALRLPQTPMELPAGRQSQEALRRLVRRYLDVAHLLIDHGASANSIGGNNMSPLHYVAMDPRLAELVPALIKHGAQIEVIGGESEETPLQTAVDNKNVAAAAALLEAGADANRPMIRNITPLLAACMTDNKPMAAVLLRHGANVEAAENNGRTPLKAAIEADDAELVAMLLKAGANPGNTAGQAPAPAEMALSAKPEVRA
ncbi:MAG: ankyrin repeat domain-containing protein [Reyranella sp.]|nr:ankyrin repeat domain-containing protein [Reyranella sp.]